MDDLHDTLEADPNVYYNMWSDHTSFINDTSPLTALEYDNCFDLLWMAHANGRLTSYSFSDELQYLENQTEDNMYMPTPPNMYPFSSFPATSDGIMQILPNQNSLVAVGCSKIRMLTHGGGGISSWRIDHCPKPTMMNGGINMLSSADTAFTCADLIRDPLFSRTSSAYAANSLIAGTSGVGAYLFDLTHSVDSPVMVYNVFQPTVKIQSNGHLIAVAGQDGNIRILDGKFRSREVTKMIEAHTGSIRDVCMQSDGRTLITCGTSKRAINPYDPKSPFHYSNDVQIRVFDLRMHRMLSPLQVTAPPNSLTGAGYLRLIPQVDTDPLEFGSLLVCTDDGYIQVSDLTAADPSSPESHQLLYAPLSSTNEIVTAAAVSSSGQFLAVGTSGGVVGQYAKPSAVAVNAFHQSSEGMKSTELYRINELSPHAKTGPPRGVPTPSPLLSLSVDNPVLGTAYALCTPHHTSAMLSSSFAMTPAVVKRKLRLVPTSRVSEELLSKSSARQDFIRHIPNPGYRPNSMKNVPKATPTTSATGVLLRPPYAVCDPRKVQILQHQQQQQQMLLANGGSAKAFSRSNSHNSELNALGGDVTGDSNSADSASVQMPPKPYLKLSSSNMSKQRFKKFNYGSVNNTPYVGLENNVPNSLINPILQLCYTLPPLRDQALLSQLNAFHYQEAHQGTVVCELGFLFHMIRLVEQYSQSCPEVDRVVRAANFQRVFQTLQLIPEAVALSLFDEAVQSDLQQFVQKFVPFLLRLLSKEIDTENAWRGPSKSRNAPSVTPKTLNVVDDLFGYSILPSTTFLHSGVYKVDPKQHRAMTLDLIYPSLTSPQNSTGPGNTSRKFSASPRGGPTPTSPLRPSTSSEELAAAARSAFPKYKVTGKKDRVNASFAAVLWGSFQREISMKGWCAESDSYEPFKKVQSLISLPKILTLLCGNTCADVKDSTTLAGAMGETLGQGNTHSNYWSWPLSVTAPVDPATATESPSKLAARRDPLLDVRPGDSREFAWLPVQVEVAFRTRSDTGRSSPPSGGLGIETSAAASVSSKLVVSCRCVPFHDKSDSQLTIWIIFDGGQEVVSPVSASQSPGFDFTARSFAGQSSGDWVVRHFRLQSLVLQVTPPPPAALAFGVPIVATAGASEKKHLVLQLNKAPADEAGTSDWFLFNDFVVEKVSAQDVVSFPAWKHPCIVCFEACGANEPSTVSPAGLTPLSTERLVVPASVLQLESLSRIPSIRLLQSFATLPGPGDLIAFDGEFVSVSLEKSIINGAGERVVSEEVRQVLARISLLDMGHGPRDTEGISTTTSSSSTAASTGGSASPTPGSSEGPGSTMFNKNMMRIIADDYILPVEPVLDYVTRFSGITEEDLNPLTSKHSILTQRAAYLKLRYFIDAKCVFVGHGLQKDFETANIFVPPEQIRDTVELWRLPNQRKISLRFLASYILKEDIQDEIHDSIEDAKTSLLLYKRYKALAAEGPDKVNAALQDLYQYGNRNNWTIGVDKLVR